MEKTNSSVATIAAKINNQELVILSENTEKYVPIKPICDVMGIDYSRQCKKIKNDGILSSTMDLMPTVAADGKVRDMICLPLKYVFGWLFTINPENVSPDARESVMMYRMQCYDVLYDHFVGRVHKQLHANEAEIAALEQLNELTTKKNEITTEMKEIKVKLEKIRSERLDPQLSLQFEN